jgi:hypothetical protein
MSRLLAAIFLHYCSVPKRKLWKDNMFFFLGRGGSVANSNPAASGYCGGMPLRCTKQQQNFSEGHVEGPQPAAAKAVDPNQITNYLAYTELKKNNSELFLSVGVYFLCSFHLTMHTNCM